MIVATATITSRVEARSPFPRLIPSEYAAEPLAQMASR